MITSIGTKRKSDMTAPVLLIEDDNDFATSLELALGLIDVAAERAATAEQAIELFNAGENSYRLIFCDIKLPGADGISCVQELLNYKNDTIVVMMTGFRDAALFDRARNAGAVEILLKPFKMADFMALTKKYLAN
jgi:DNA-binding NtrC family response regulator